MKANASEEPIIPLTDEQREECARVIPIVKSLAARFSRMHRFISRCELVSAGYEAIVRAAPQFAGARGPIEGLLAQAARWAMLDAIRETARLEVRERGVDRGAEGALERDLRLRAALETAASIMEEDTSDTEADLLDQRNMRLGFEVLGRVEASLPEPEATFFRQRIREERTRQEIAEAMSISMSTLGRVAEQVNEKVGAALRAEGLL